MSFSVLTIAMRAFCPSLVLKVNLRVTKLTYLICHPCHVLNTAQIMHRLWKTLFSLSDSYLWLVLTSHYMSGNVLVN